LWRRIGLSFSDENRVQYIKDLLHKLTELYLRGKFFIDVDELFECNANEAFVSAIERVKGEL
jgi:hypothetical protein